MKRAVAVILGHDAELDQKGQEMPPKYKADDVLAAAKKKYPDHNITSVAAIPCTYDGNTEYMWSITFGHPPGHDGRKLMLVKIWESDIEEV